MSRQEEDYIQDMAGRIGIDLSAGQINQLAIYICELWEWNRKINLTGLSSRKQIITELVLDSLICAQFMPDSGRLLDIGSGAGFPALPLKIKRPDLETSLVEPRHKRANFLRHIIRILRLDGISITRGRIEQSCQKLNRHGYQAVTARALAPLPTVLDWASPWIAEHGSIINFQGADFKDVLKQSSDILKRHGLYLDRCVPYLLPYKTVVRHILIFRRKRGLSDTCHL